MGSWYAIKYGTNFFTDMVLNLFKAKYFKVIKSMLSVLFDMRYESVWGHHFSMK